MNQRRKKNHIIMFVVFKNSETFLKVLIKPSRLVIQTHNSKLSQEVY